MELIVFPEAHVDVMVGKTVNSFTLPALLELANVLGTIGIAIFAVLRSKSASGIEELAEEFFTHGDYLVGLFFGRVEPGFVGVVGCDHHV